MDMGKESAELANKAGVRGDVAQANTSPEVALMLIR